MSVIAMIADEDTITGMLLAGAGASGPGERRNFFVCTPDTPKAELRAAFDRLIARADVSALFVAKFAAEKLQDAISAYEGKGPVLLEIPGKADED